MMSDLRVSLLGIGALIVVALLLIDRLRRRRALKRSWHHLPDPADRLGVDDLESDLDDWEVIPISTRTHAMSDDDLGAGFAADHDSVELDGESRMTADDREVVGGPERDIGDAEGSVADAAPQTIEASQPNTSEDAAATATSTREPMPPSETVLVLSVLAPEGRLFGGTEIFAAAGSAGLQFDTRGIFHAYPATGGEMPIFSMANILEPGSFDRARMATIGTPGMVLFLQLPGPQGGREAFATMLAAARQLSAQLGGSLGDGRRRPLSGQAARALVEQATPYSALPASQR